MEVCHNLIRKLFRKLFPNLPIIGYSFCSEYSEDIIIPSYGLIHSPQMSKDRIKAVNQDLVCGVHNFLTCQPQPCSAFLL